MTTSRRPIYVNVLDCQTEGTPDWTLRRSIEAGLVVLNAPRPLVSFRGQWVGPFRAGIFYAAYLPADVPAWESWARLDADDVELITNDEIVAKVEDQLDRQGYSFADYEKAGTTREEAISWVASYLYLPWRPGQLEEAR